MRLLGLRQKYRRPLKEKPANRPPHLSVSMRTRLGERAGGLVAVIGVWATATELAARLLAQHAVQPSPGFMLSNRILPEEHFEFQGGSLRGSLVDRDALSCERLASTRAASCPQGDRRPDRSCAADGPWLLNATAEPGGRVEDEKP